VTTIPASIPATFATAVFSTLLLAAALPAQTTDAAAQTTEAVARSGPAPSGAAPSGEVSKIRIVRLSEVKGIVLLDRNTGSGFEPAVTNMPIVERSRLETGDGVAEVEFEDSSTLRLAPDSMVEFPQLDRIATGTASSAHLVKGMAYVSLMKTRGNEFTLLFGQQTLPLPPASHIRLQLDGAQARLAVLDGVLRIDGPSGPMDVSRKQTVTFQMQGQGQAQTQAQPELAKNIAPAPYDTWDRSATGYHAQTAGLSAFSGSPYAYGLNDMAYYGSFMDAGGCGSMWRPYFASAAWSPYSNGVWAFYPGAGYSWVSPYPWGWTPFHYGSWSYCAGAGWGWQPGGTWNGLSNIATGPVTGTFTGSGIIPTRPLKPPVAGGSTLLVVSAKPIVRSDAASADSFVLRKDSAGLGVPREGLGNLNKLSQRAIERGTATAAIPMSGLNPAAANGRPASMDEVRGSQNQGFARPSESSQPSRAEMPSHAGSEHSGGNSAGGSAPSAGAAPAAGRGR
jgi:hypothetical protein